MLYIYIYRERERYVYIYIYIYTNTHTLTIIMIILRSHVMQPADCTGHGTVLGRRETMWAETMLPTNRKHRSVMCRTVDVLYAVVFQGRGNHVGRNHVGRFTGTGCTGTLVQVLVLQPLHLHQYTRAAGARKSANMVFCQRGFRGPEIQPRTTHQPY